MRRTIPVLIALLLALAACSSGSSSDGDGGDESGDTASGVDAEATDEPETTEEEPDPCVDALEIVNGEAETETTVTDGEFEAVTMWADKAPHPDNTVDYDQALDLGFFTYEYGADDQFGYTIPIDPDTPDGEHFMSLALSNPDEPVAAGQTYVGALEYPDTPDADGEITFTYWEQGSDRLLPGDISVTITEITDDQVCGEISTVTGTDLQQFVGIEGTFVADRAQALDAAADGE